MRLPKTQKLIEEILDKIGFNDDNKTQTKKGGVIKESSLSRIESKIRSYPCGIISAYRDNEGVCGDGESVKNSVNRKNHRKLLNHIRDLGYGVTQGVSRYEEQGVMVSEQCIFVADEFGVGGLEDTLRTLAKERNQESFIYTKLETSEVLIEGLNDCSNSFLKTNQRLSTDFDSVSYGKESSIYTSIGGRSFFYTFGKFKELPVSGKSLDANGSFSKNIMNEFFKKEIHEYYHILKEENQLQERLALKGDYKGNIFQRLVGAVYQTMPLYTKSHRYAWEDLIKKFTRQKEFLSGEFDLVKTQEDPYPSSKAMSKNFDAQKASGVDKIKVRTYAEEPKGDGSEDNFEGHPVFSNDENIDVRFVHDIMAHYYGGHPFSSRGEYGAYNRHTKTLGPDTPASEALFTEVVAQTSCYYVYGDFVEQKATLMTKYFDHQNVGALSRNSPFNKYFHIIDKELVKKDDFDRDEFMREFPKISNELIRQERLGKNKAPLQDIL